MSKNRNMSGGLFTSGKPKSLTIKETPLSKQIAEWLDNRAVYNDRLNCGKVETRAGYWITLCKARTPDSFAIVRGNIIFIETKLCGKKPTPEQTTRHETLMNFGAIVIVADSFDSFTQQFSAIRVAIEQQARTPNFYD